MPSPKRIGKIEFGLLSPKEIRTMSVRKIIWADTYDDDGFPYPQGLMDLNLGVIDPGLRCKTCDQKASECPGHFGHIELCKARYTCRVYTADTKTPPCDLPELQQIAPLTGRGREGNRD